MSGSLRDCLIKAQKCAFTSREKLGVSHRAVALVTRTWSGKEPGEGSAKDSIQVISPRPIVEEIAHDIAIRDGGAVKQGDLFIKGLFKDDFPTESDVDAQTKYDARNIEQFYKIGDYLYKSIYVKDNFTSWDVQVRRLTDQRGF